PTLLQRLAQISPTKTLARIVSISALTYLLSKMALLKKLGLVTLLPTAGPVPVLLYFLASLGLYFGGKKLLKLAEIYLQKLHHAIKDYRDKRLVKKREAAAEKGVKLSNEISSLITNVKTAMETTANALDPLLQAYRTEVQAAANDPEAIAALLEKEKAAL